MIRIGLPKGIVRHRSHCIISRLTGDVPDSRRLCYRAGDIDIHLVKHRDVPRLVHDGFLDLGITSSEWVAERGLALSELSYFDWCDTRISLIGPVGTPIPPKNVPLSIVTEYPRIARQELARNGYDEVTCYTISGSTEALVPAPFGYGVDCVETGQTLMDNGLEEKTCLFNARIVAVCAIGQEQFGRKLLAFIGEAR